VSLLEFVVGFVCERGVGRNEERSIGQCGHECICGGWVGGERRDERTTETWRQRPFITIVFSPVKDI
jgi:hypothetical protein